MLSKNECVRTRSAITSMEIIDKNSFIFTTVYNGAKIISLKECSTLQNIIIKNLNHQTTAIDFSPSSNFLAFANANIIYIYDIHNKNIIQTIRTNEGNINLLKFIPNSPYIITGTSYGRVMQYRYDGRAQLSRLCSFGHNKHTKSLIKNNYVSAIAFYDDYLACTGYGGYITVVRLKSRSFKTTIHNSKVKINSLIFLDKNTIISANADGVIQIQKVNKYKKAKNISTPFSTVKEMLRIPQTNYIIISGDSNNLAVIDIKTEKLISTKYLHFEYEIRNIKLTIENDLLVFLESKQLLLCELPKAQHLKSYIFNNKLDKAFNLVERYPTLKGTREHKRIEVLYEKLYSDAIEALIKSNKKEAIKIIDIFKNVKTKSDEVNKIFKDFNHYHRFRTLYHEKKHSLAYALSEKYPSLKRTREYKKMEELFKENFNFAQKQILLGRQDMAKELLSPYASIISKRDILDLILKNNKDFIDFLIAIEHQEFKTIEKLAIKYEIFKTIPSYISLQNNINDQIDNIKNILKKGDIDKAKQYITKLKNINYIEDDLNNLKNTTKEIEILHKFYDKNHFIKCYEFIDTHPHLDELELTYLLEKHWEKLILECEQYALKGNLKNIKSTLNDLIKVRTRKEKIGDLIRVSFHTKIKTLIAKRNLKNAENIIYSYMDIFGIDSELRYIMKIFEKVSEKKLAINLNKNISRDNWLNSKLIVGEN